MGVVYKAQDTKLDRTVALKFLPSHLHLDNEAEQRFISEAKAASSFDHPNICTIYDINKTDEDQLFIAMACYEGETLKKKLEKGPINIKEAIDIAAQIAEGLNRAHQKGIIHRDIKPANIFITNDGIVKILDFGLAKVNSQAQLTTMGTTMGTVAYMSPEQTKGEEVDQRTDIWSFGVVLYEMLTGELPFKGDYEQAIIYSILNEDAKPLHDINPQISQVVLKCLNKKPEERLQNTDELLVDLKEVENQLKGVNGNTIVPPPRKSKIRNSYIYAGLAAIILLITIVSIFFFPEIENEKSIDLIAVLPFSNNKPDPETDYLGFAIADQIIGDLAYLKNITVRPSSSIRKYEKQAIDPIIAGDDLNVDYVLTGNYLKEANTVRLNVELVEANTNEMIWREPIEVDFNNAFELQDIVAEKVVKRLNVKFSQKEISRIGKDIPKNPLAYEYYLRSISYPLSNEGDRLAIKMLNKSIELDSSYAPAYNQLGNRIHRLTIYGLGSPEETKRAEYFYLKALSLNDELIAALSNLAILYTETARTGEAVNIVKQVLEINSNNAKAHFSLGYIYRYAGMNNEAILEMEKAISLEPENSTFRSIIITYLWAGDYEKAIEKGKIFKESAYTLDYQGQALFRQGNKKKAVEYMDRAISMEPDGGHALTLTGIKASIDGNREEGLAATLMFEEYDLEDAEAWYFTAGNYGLLGDKEGCIRCLRKAVDRGFFNYPFMLMDSFLDSARDEPEFQEILEIAKEKHLRFKKKFFSEKS